MPERTERDLQAARARVRALALDAIARGAPTEWFEALYREAAGDARRIPWADLEPNPDLVAWTSRPGALAGARTAAVVGCGLGDDAEHLAGLGLEVTAFDVAATAVAWARRLHPASRVRYEVADLLAPPPAWRGRFDVVVEVYTLQALPPGPREAAARALVALLAPGGRLFLFTRVRPESPLEAPEGPPWPLTRAEVGALVAGLVPVQPLREARDPQDPGVVRAHGVWARPR